MGLNNDQNIDSLYSSNSKRGGDALEFNRRATSVNQATAVSGETPPRIASLTLTSDIKGVVAEWDDPNYSVREYELEISDNDDFAGSNSNVIGGGSYTQTYPVAPPALAHVFKKLVSSIATYYARIRIVGMTGLKGEWSNEASTGLDTIDTTDITNAAVVAFSSATDAVNKTLNNSNGGSVNTSELSVDDADANTVVVITVTINFSFASIWNASATLNDMDIKLRFADDGDTPVAIGGDHTLTLDFKSTLPTDIAAWGTGTPADTSDNIITAVFAPHIPGAGSHDYDIEVVTNTNAGGGGGGELYVLIDNVQMDAQILKR